MKLYDLSLTISEELPVWPGDPGAHIILTSSIKEGAEANLTRVEMGAHTGTHIDAPFHFEPDGAGIDELPIGTLVGPCRVYEIKGPQEGLGAAILRGLDFYGVTRALFKTENSRLWEQGITEFQKKYIHITEDGAGFLVERGIKLVGVDYLSVEKYASPDHSTHHTLLRNQVVVVEGLNLSKVPPGDYQLMALPMKIKGADGAPARVVIAQQTE